MWWSIIVYASSEKDVARRVATTLSRALPRLLHVEGTFFDEGDAPIREVCKSLVAKGEGIRDLEVGLGHSLDLDVVWSLSPTFPRLHTLRICGNRYRESHKTIVLPSNPIPSLRNLSLEG